MCAYTLNEEDPEKKVYSQDFCDDGEIGAARHLLKLLHDCELKNRVIFVVRYCGDKLGPSRFDQILEAAKRALATDTTVEIASAELRYETDVKQKNQFDQSAGYKDVPVKRRGYGNYNYRGSSSNRRRGYRYRGGGRSYRGGGRGVNRGQHNPRGVYRRSSPQTGEKRLRDNDDDDNHRERNSRSPHDQNFVFSKPQTLSREEEQD